MEEEDLTDQDHDSLKKQSLELIKTSNSNQKLFLLEDNENSENLLRPDPYFSASPKLNRNNENFATFKTINSSKVKTIASNPNNNKLKTNLVVESNINNNPNLLEYSKLNNITNTEIDKDSKLKIYKITPEISPLNTDYEKSDPKIFDNESRYFKVETVLDKDKISDHTHSQFISKNDDANGGLLNESIKNKSNISSQSNKKNDSANLLIQVKRCETIHENNEKTYKKRETFNEKNKRNVHFLNLANFLKSILKTEIEEQSKKTQFNYTYPVEFRFLEDIVKHEFQPPKEAEVSALFFKIRVADFMTMYFTMLGMLCGIFSYEFVNNSDFNQDDLSTPGSISPSTLSHVCLIICTASNFFFIISSILRKILNVQLGIALKDLNQSQTIWDYKMMTELLIEIILAVVQPNIFCKDISFTTSASYYLQEVEYTLNDYLMIVLLIRIYVFLRFIISSSLYYGERAQRVTKMFGGNLSRLFVVKCILTTNPFFCLFVFLAPIALMFAYMMKVVEGPVFAINTESLIDRNDFRYIENCVWYVLVTMATVGYGDYYPKTNLGRLIGVLIAITGTLFVSTLIIFLQLTLKMTSAEIKTVEFYDRITFKDEMKNKVGFFFLNTYKYRVYERRYLDEYYKDEKDKNKLRRIKNELKKITYKRIEKKKKFKQMIHQFRNVFELPDAFDIIISRISEIEKHMQSVLTQGENMSTKLGTISSEVDKLLKMKKEFFK